MMKAYKMTQAAKVIIEAISQKLVEISKDKQGYKIKFGNTTLSFTEIIYPTGAIFIHDEGMFDEVIATEIGYEIKGHLFNYDKESQFDTDINLLKGQLDAINVQ
jgi:hypothetical protein